MEASNQLASHAATASQQPLQPQPSCMSGLRGLESAERNVTLHCGCAMEGTSTSSSPACHQFDTQVAVYCSRILAV